MNNWGIEEHNAKLLIDAPCVLDLSKPVIVDVEDDEQSGFVGIGLTQDGKDVYYYSALAPQAKTIVESFQLVGHNLKYDFKQLVKWGMDVKPSQIQDDTILMSYVKDTTKVSHGLKELGEELGFTWPTYKEMVGTGKQKKTLDKQPVWHVAKYCAMDALVTFRLYQKFLAQMTTQEIAYYRNIELPLMRVLAEMELKGVLIDVKRLEELHKEFSGNLDLRSKALFALAGKEFNPNSNKQTAEILEARGIALPTTPKGNKKVDKFVLEQNINDDFCKELIEFNKIEKLISTYTGGMLERNTLPRIYCKYNQIIASGRGITTGRLSSSDPNLQQIPIRTEEGEKLRELIIPSPGHSLIVADYSQIEYRLLAHFTQEPILIEAFKNGRDVHEETGKALGVDRDTGKILNFASVYGAQAKRIAQTAKCSEANAEAFLKRYWQVLPSVTSWINRVKYNAQKQRGVRTLMGRFIPLPGINSPNKYDRLHWERVAVNATIQGSAAEVMKLAMVQVRAAGLIPYLTVHDELAFEVESASDENALDLMRLNDQKEKIKNIMENVVRLDVPLVVEPGAGSNWREAK